MEESHKKHKEGASQLLSWLLMSKTITKKNVSTKEKSC